MNTDTNLSRVLTGTRSAGTALLLLMGTFAGFAALSIGKFVEVVEYSVTGGKDAIPPLTKFIINNEKLLLIVPPIATASALCFLWTSQRLPAVLTALFWGLFVQVLAGSAICLGMIQPFIVVIVHFKG